MRRFSAILVLGVPGLVFCSTLIPTQPNIEPDTESETEIQRDAVRVFFELSRDLADQSPILPGSSIELIASFDPVLHYEVFDREGESVRDGYAPKDLHNVQEMRFCMTIEPTCESGMTWQTFQLEETFQVEVDWTGEKTFWLVTEFRGRDGRIIPSFQDPASLEQQLSIPLTLMTE